MKTDVSNNISIYRVIEIKADKCYFVNMITFSDVMFKLRVRIISSCFDIDIKKCKLLHYQEFQTASLSKPFTPPK